MDDVKMDRVAPEIGPPPSSGEDHKVIRRRPWGRVVTGLVVLALIAGGAAWWFFRPHGPAAPAKTGGRFASGAVMPVGAATAVKGAMKVTLDGLGTVTPLATVTVRTQINGQLTKIAFTEGQMVK
ncbi:MAG TPA: efflux transporter periplasmic adaptor subunit, partial [Stellaceae bacterium]|nr:efflux transporter periplasmic adaptor subunit [Stellaceae bacterium]